MITSAGVDPMSKQLDGFGHLLKQSFKQFKLSTRGIYENQDHGTATFVGFIGPEGDFLYGIADMDIHTSLPETHIDANLKYIEGADIITMDTNWSAESLIKVGKAAYYKVPHVIIDPISKEKTAKLMVHPLLSLITILKPNHEQFHDIYTYIIKKEGFKDIASPLTADQGREELVL